MRVVGSSIILALLCAGAAAAPQLGGNGPTVTFPDGSVLRLPAPSRSFEPDGPLATPPPMPSATPGPKEVDTPAPAAPPLGNAERRKRALDELYARLAHAKDPIEAQAIGAMIATTLLHSGSETADLLMDRAITAIDTKDYATATGLLDKVITLRPHWAEAWNKRATVRYLDDNDVGAMGDIGQVLLLEPRHIGALSGMGLILHRNGDDRGALTVLRKAQAIDPQDAGVKLLIDQLGPDVEGHEL